MWSLADKMGIVWSAIKFTHPKKGKIYNNSHAELKSRTTES